MSNAPKYRKDIQVLRGLAVLAVIFYHAKDSLFPLGYLGVDVFFVISGFVVTPLILRIFTDQTNVQERLSNLRFFYKRRFCRLAPALAVTLAISAVTIFLLGPINDHQRFARQGIATLLLVGNVGAHNYSGDYFSPNPNPLVHTWSLSIEEQIYIFLPLIMLIILRKRTGLKKITITVLGFISVISFISFLFPIILQPLYSRAGIEFASQFSFYSPIDRIWQFTVGGIAFILLDRFQDRAIKISKGVHLLTVLSVVVILFGPLHMSLKVSSILASLLAVIVILSKSLDLLPNFLIQKLKWVGDRSYSIYLAHMPLLYIAKYSPVMEFGTNENRRIQSVIAVIMSIILGALSYSTIENKFRGQSKTQRSYPKFISVALLLTLFLPLSLYATIESAVSHNYWGVNRNIPQPAFPGDLLTGCVDELGIGKICINTNIGANKTVLLIGDSHAGHISIALRDAAREVNWNSVYLRTGALEDIAPTDDAISSDSYFSYLIDWVSLNQPELIVISEYVSVNSSQDAIKSVILQLKSLVPDILLVENNPIWPDGTRFNFSSSLIKPYAPPKSFEHSLMQTVDKNASDELSEWARENGITTLNFDSIFCKSSTCIRFSEGEWLYRDDNHFSVAGAELTIPLLVSHLKRF